MIYQGKIMKITFCKLILSAAVCLLVFSGCSNLTLELKKAPANKQLASGSNPADPGGNPADPGEPSSARHVVTFNSKGGTTVQTVFVQDGDAIPEPQQKPTKKDSAANGGNEFVGWYADEACTTPWDFKQTISGDTTLYANWMPEWISIGGNKWATRNVQ